MTNVLIIGAGGIGERHLRCFQRIGAGLVGIVEANPERLASVSARYGCPAFSAWAEAEKKGPWNIGVIATPAPAHVSLAVELLKSGLDVLIEKPLAVSLQGLDELQALEKSRTVRVAYVYRHIEPVMELKRRLESGQLGRPLSALVTCGEDFSLARPDYARLYYARHETGGGAIQDVLTHFTNAMDWLVGPAQAVQCLSGNRMLKNVFVEDTVCCAIRHAEGCLVNYMVSQGQAPKETSFTVHGEDGTLHADLTAMRIGEFRRGGKEWEWIRFEPCERDHFYDSQAADFLAACNGINGRSCSLDEAIHSLKVNLAALESSRSGNLIPIMQ